MEKKERTYLFIAGTEEELKLWIFCISAVMRNKLEDLKNVQTYEEIPFLSQISAQSHRKLEYKASTRAGALVKGQFSQIKVNFTAVWSRVQN